MTKRHETPRDRIRRRLGLPAVVLGQGSYVQVWPAEKFAVRACRRCGRTFVGYGIDARDDADVALWIHHGDCHD